MSKSIKFKNNNYLDSSSIVHKRKKLSDILEQSTIQLTFNEEYVYLTDLGYSCFKIGRLVFLDIYCIAFKKEVPNYTWLISGLPKINTYPTFYLNGGVTASGTTARCSITPEGRVQTHWGSPTSYGDSANKQYYGTIIYKSIE